VKKKKEFFNKVDEEDASGLFTLILTWSAKDEKDGEH
jgi:hypothetical protein